MEFVELTEHEYDIFARKHPYHNFLNGLQAFQIKKSYGWKVAFLGVKEAEKLIAATGIVFVPCMKTKYYAYAQRGFLLNFHNVEVLQFFHTALYTYLKEKKVVYLKLDPYVQYQEHDINGAIVEGGFYNQDILDNMKTLGYEHQGFTTGFSADSQVRWMFTLSLVGKNEADLLQEMDHQTRWSVNKTIKMGIKVRQLRLDELTIFQQIMKYASSTREFHDMPIEHYQQQITTYGEEHAKVMIAYIDVPNFQQQLRCDLQREEATLAEIQAILLETPNSKKYVKKEKVQLEAINLLKQRILEIEKAATTHGDMIPLAASYFILYEDEMVYVSAGSYDEFRKYNGPYAIQWHMLRYALENGYQRYNFYGTSGNFAKDASDHGVLEFKKGFNGVVEEYLGEFILPIQKMQYTLYSTLKKLKQ